MFLIYIFLRLFASYVATFSTWVSFAQRKCATGTENMHVICIFGYYNTDDLRKAAFLQIAVFRWKRVLVHIMLAVAAEGGGG